MNATLSAFDRPPLHAQIIASYIGDGAYTLVERAMSHETFASADQVEQAHQWFLSFYRRHKLDYTYVYPGVEQALAQLREHHPSLPMAVLTNKPVVPSREICRHFGLHRFFFAIYGGNSFATKKPHPQGMLTLIDEAARLTGSVLQPSDATLIGDSHVDVETARAAGARVLGCSFGLAPESLANAGPDAMVDSPAEWPVALGLL